MRDSLLNPTQDPGDMTRRNLVRTVLGVGAFAWALKWWPRSSAAASDKIVIVNGWIAKASDLKR